MIDLRQGDCLEVMDELIKQGVKVDAIICDPPYGTTACKWDSVIPFNDYVEILDKGKIHIEYEEESVLRYVKNGTPYDTAKQIFDRDKKKGMWSYLNKLIKPNGAIVLFGSEPFSSALRMSNIKNYKYDWVWNKKKGGNPLLAKKQPIKITENIIIFNTKLYYPLMTIRDKPKSRGSNKHKISETTKNAFTENKIYTHKYPKNIIEISNANQRGKVHPTQKPVALMEYLIKTYTNEDETVLDFTMGSGSTGVGCIKTNRNFYGIEKDKAIYDIACERIEGISVEEIMKEVKKR